MKVNQVINIDKTKEKDYNKIDLINEETFTYYDYLKYKLFEKVQKAKNTTLHEQKEKYKRLEKQENAEYCNEKSYFYYTFHRNFRHFYTNFHYLYKFNLIQLNIYKK